MVSFTKQWKKLWGLPLKGTDSRDNKIPDSDGFAINDTIGPDM